MTQKTFIFIGRSGCGKGTQASLLSDYLKKNDANRDVLYIQTGAELREFIKGDSETQRLAKIVYDAGGLMPEFMTVNMWINVLINKYKKDEHLIFDGSPRKYHEAGVLNSIIDFYKLGKPFVVNIEISKEESINRLMARGRIDDNRDDIEVRLSWYETDVVPAMEYYKKNPDYHFIKLDGMRKVEEISKELISKIEELENTDVTNK